jgi:hypothetical protein
MNRCFRYAFLRFSRRKSLQGPVRLLDKTVGMANIQNSIRALADQFVKGVLDALSSASLAELSALGGGSGGVDGLGRGGRGRKGRAASSAAQSTGRGKKGARGGASARAAGGKGGKKAGRRIRRSSEDVVELAGKVADFVRSSGGNVAVSEIAKALGMSTADVNRPVTIALNEGRIKKTGEKRLTRYHPAGGKKKKLSGLG